MNYLKAVLRKDTKTKITELKKLINLGSKLNKDTRPDIKKLEILQKRKTSKATRTKKNISINNKYSIKSVYTKNNTVVVNFNSKISKDFIKFFELKKPSLYKDVFDIKGRFKDAQPTKLKLNSVQKISIGQYKDNTLRIVFANKENLKTFYTIKEKQIIISIQSKNTKKIEYKKVSKIIYPKTKNKYIDLKNSIRSFHTTENSIIIKFNKTLSKNDFKYSSYKNRLNYEDVFDLKGTFAYTKPLKLKIDGLNKITVSTKDSKNIRLRISDKRNLRVFYILKKKELIIKILGLDEDIKKATSSKTISTKPYKNFKSKTIVIDAGHGGHDVGAVGPNKRYEKVVTLKVAKYLYSILKQRGHKVYLTRNNDSFIKVGKRTDLALRKNADIFISIHANSVPKKDAAKVSGMETYYLSNAKSAKAKRVAAKENKSDIRKMKMNNSSVNALMLGLNPIKIQYSRLLSIDVQREMLNAVRKKYKVKDKGSRPGPFWVLLDAPQASILVELGYISHPLESKRLYSSSYQKILAGGIANGVDAYFEMKARFD